MNEVKEKGGGGARSRAFIGIFNRFTFGEWGGGMDFCVPLIDEEIEFLSRKRDWKSNENHSESRVKNETQIARDDQLNSRIRELRILPPSEAHLYKSYLGTSASPGLTNNHNSPPRGGGGEEKKHIAMKSRFARDDDNSGMRRQQIIPPSASKFSTPSARARKSSFENFEWVRGRKFWSLMASNRGGCKY